MYNYYFDLVIKRESNVKVKALTHTKLGCQKLYADEGRRLPCIAYEIDILLLTIFKSPLLFLMKVLKQHRSNE